MKTVEESMRQYREEIIEIGRTLFDCPELGFKEKETMEIMHQFLKKHDIEHTCGLAETGIVATLGKKGYHIAIVTDLDALLVREEDRCYPFHSCGHSIQNAIGLYVMVALKDSGLLDEVEGRVSLIAAPAEEFVDLDARREMIQAGKIQYASGKQNLISMGIFDDVDCVLSAHIMGVDEKHKNAKFDVGSTLSGFLSKEVTFLGKAAHSGAQPHLGINALHTANLMMQALSFVKESMNPEDGIRIYPIMKEGGSSINTICDRAILQTYIRANTTEALFEAEKRFDEIAQSCAKIMRAEVNIQTDHGYMPLRQSDELNAIVKEQMLKYCTEKEILEGPISGASGDIGDLSTFLPTIQFGFSGFEGRIHSNQFKIIDETHAYETTTKVILDTIYECLLHPERQVYNKKKVEDLKKYKETWL